MLKEDFPFLTDGICVFIIFILPTKKWNRHNNSFTTKTQDITIYRIFLIFLKSNLRDNTMN